MHFQYSVGGMHEEDVMYWKEDMSGVYTVRSAYRLIQRQKEIDVPAASSELWKQIWRIKAPPKVLNLIWRASTQCLPTRVNLQMKRVMITGLCPMCNGREETIMHALVSYPFANQCWRQRSLVFQEAEN